MSTRWLIGFLGASVAAGLVFVAWLYWRPKPPFSPPDPFPLPPYSESRYLNTGPDAHYVGTNVCAGCHTGKHESYLLTAHSRALADLDPNAEPSDGAFFHKASGRSYRVYRQDGQLRHEEVLRTAEGKEIARTDLPIRYVIGSGNYSRSYLVDVDGFLMESPITWYASKNKWDVSPGYDTPHPLSFERHVNMSCLICHAGRVEAVGGAVNRLTLHEKAIGCESCHGPGSLHVAFQKTGKYVPGDEDLTIVHPGKLSRPRLEAVCAMCHLDGPATVHLRGRQPIDFRPGMQMTDYRIDYRFDTANEQMTVVGHMEQLWQSKCYQKSNDLTCVTCHDPHASEKPKDPVAFYRQKCLNCHTPQACGLEQTQRLKKNPTDNCMACHMPRGDTEIAHIAFTHHRIGLHGDKPPASGVQRVPELVPIADVSQLPPLEQQRNLGLAYMAAIQSKKYAKYDAVFRDRARILLEGVRAAGLREGETAEALSDLHVKDDPALAIAYARQAVEAKDTPDEARVMALSRVANSEVANRDYESAIGLLKELTRLRRTAMDWGLLGRCYRLQNQPEQALKALEQALAIRPDSAPVHFEIAEVYQKLGDAQRANEHKEKGQWLLQHGQ